MGTNANDSLLGSGGTSIEFTSFPPTLKYFDTYYDIDNSAQICDENGAPLFYSNGCSVINAQGQLMLDGDSLGQGTVRDLQCEYPDYAYSFLHQGLLILPDPGDASQYYLFHLNWQRRETPPPIKLVRDFYYSRIDMRGDNGLGAVVEKNHLVLQDTNLTPNLTAVRHGNGRDWWLVLPRGQSDLIYTFLLSPEGLQGPFRQAIGRPTTQRAFTAGQLVFSPDGTRFVRTSASDDGVDLFNFDRCSGLFSCPRRLPYPSAEIYPTGAAISPNSRFLYVSTTVEMYQYDLWASDIAGSKVLLDVYDGFIGDYDAVSFYFQMLAPDGKIYMSATNGVRYLHVVHHPDSAGLACDFRQHDLRLPTHVGYALPNFPHFRLYDAPGSPCDTLGIDAPAAYRRPWAPTESLRLVPNPTAAGLVTVRFTPCSGGLLRVFDVAGREVLHRTVGRENEHVIDCAHWPAGVYIVSHQPRGGEDCRPESGKLVVTR